MLHDIFTSFKTRCSPHIRRLGYVDETIAMRKRFAQRSAAWQPHLDKSRDVVLSAAERCKSRNKVVILGSGLLLDVPLSELASRFRRVVLMDVVCLPEIRKRITRFGNATFIEHDVTGIAEPLFRNKLRGIHELPGIRPGSAEIHGDADLVVSLNILSQLWVIPRAYAIDPKPPVSQEQLEEWCRRIVESHYSLLRSLPCNVCLIGDYEFVRRDKSGNIVSKGSTVYDLALSKPEKTWTWTIEPLEGRNQFTSKELLVGAWHLR